MHRAACAVCSDHHSLTCSACAAPVVYRRGDRRPWDAHGPSHHWCAAPAVPPSRLMECRCGALVEVDEQGAKRLPFTNTPHRCRPAAPARRATAPAPRPLPARNGREPAAQVEPQATTIWRLEQEP